MANEISIKKLNRLQLIEIMLEQEKKIKRLEKEIATLKDNLELRKKLAKQKESIHKVMLAKEKMLDTSKDEII